MNKRDRLTLGSILFGGENLSGLFTNSICLFPACRSEPGGKYWRRIWWAMKQKDTQGGDMWSTHSMGSGRLQTDRAGEMEKRIDV